MKPFFVLVFCLFCGVAFVVLGNIDSFGQTESQIARKNVASESNWPQWKGAKKNNKSLSKNLIPSWAEAGPELLWKSTGLGNGHSSLSFFGRFIYTMGDVDGKSCLIALNRQTGKVVWKTEVGAAGGSFAGPRSTPATDGRLVFAYNQFGDLLCANALTGKPVWKINFPTDLASRQQISKLDGKTSWGVAESPFLFRDTIFMAPGGSQGAVVALEKSTGKVRWRCKELTEAGTYTSVTPIVIDKTPQLLVVVDDSIAGVDVLSGKLLWRVDWPSVGSNCSDPVYWDHTVFMSAAYGVGAKGYHVEKRPDGTFNAQQIYENKRIQNRNFGMILDKGVVYTSNRSGEMICLDIKTGEYKWSQKGFSGDGSALTWADGLLIARAESGEVRLFEANQDKYVERGRFMQPDRTEVQAWTYPLVVDGKLYLRDQNKLFCYELKK